MFKTFLKFELKSWLKAPMPWIFFLIFALISLLATVSDSVSIGGSFGNIKKNAPFVAENWYAVFSLLSLLLATAFLNSAALRDFERNTSQIVFSKPIGKGGYYFGHFLGAFIASLIPLIGISVGIWTGTFLNSIFHWLDESRFGPSGLSGHLEGFFVFAVPNLLFIGGIVFAVAAKTRSTMYSFVTAVAILVGYLISGTLIRNLDNEWIAAMIDPFGMRTFSIATKYWTVDLKNTSAIGFSGILLWNRILWTLAGLTALFIGYRAFSFSEKNNSRSRFANLFNRKRNSISNESLNIEKLHMHFGGEIPKVKALSGSQVVFAQLISQIKTEWKYIVRSVPFILLALLGILNAWGALANATDSYNTHELPVTYTMINIIRGSFYLFTMIVMVYFSGAIIWKERNAQISDITDALPTKNWTSLAGKYVAVLGAMFVLQLVIISVAILSQIAAGYHQYDLWLYVRELLLMDMLNFMFILALAFLVQALSPNMYLGFFVVIIFIAGLNFALQALDWSSKMVDFGSLPGYVLSDFYGYAPFKTALAWFGSYWFLFSLLLVLAAILFWPRGRETGWKGRFKLASLEWKNYKNLTWMFSIAWIGVAAFVFYNTKILNKNTSPKEMEKLSVRYEKDYKRLASIPQPRVYNVKFDIDLTPEERKLSAAVQYAILNKHHAPLDTFIMNVPRDVDFELNEPRLKLVKNDVPLNFRLYRFEPALQPGDSLLLKFNVKFEPKGFQNDLKFSTLVQNGTFFNNSDIVPIFGYDESSELTDKNDRKKYGLPEKSRRPALNRKDTLNRMNSYIAMSADWVNVETIIRTASDQIAIAPGSLVKEWTEKGKRCFQYKLDHKSFNFYSFMSARYQVKRKTWNGIQLEVYYHKGHEYNVDRMLNAMQKALEYYTTNFGPYYHKQCRIIEFPRFSDFAQAFPGTMPYSEGIGFIQDFREKEDDVDMVTYVASHEIGHQWWAHQECGAQMQGGEMLVETFAQYSALMVMEHMYGKDQMRKFLKYEMDNYLRGRSRERLKELPLCKAEGQGYIHYNKGSLAMYALKETIGEDKVNLALRNFLSRYRYAEPPYPVSLDAIDEFYAQTPDSLKFVVNDWFESITIYENRCNNVKMRSLPNGKYEITIDIESRKLKADDQGKNKEVALNDYIEIGAFAKPAKDKKFGKLLYRQKVKINKAQNSFTFVVNEKPEKAGVDPFNLLVDLSPEDNMKESK